MRYISTDKNSKIKQVTVKKNEPRDSEASETHGTKIKSIYGTEATLMIA